MHIKLNRTGIDENTAIVEILIGFELSLSSLIFAIFELRFFVPFGHKSKAQPQQTFNNGWISKWKHWLDHRFDLNLHTY